MRTEDILQCIGRELKVDSELQIDVRRKFVLLDALKEGHKKKFATTKVLKVYISYSCRGPGIFDTGTLVHMHAHNY